MPGTIRVGQGGYATATKNEDIVLYTGDILECASLMVIGYAKVALLHVDLYTNAQNIYDVISKEFHADKQLDICLIPGFVKANNPESQKAYLENGKKIRDAQQKLIEKRIKVEVSVVANDAYIHPTTKLICFGYDVKNNELVTIENSGRFFDPKNTLEQNIVDPFYCKQALSFIYRSLGEHYNAPLTNFRNFTLPITEKTLIQFSKISSLNKYFPLNDSYPEEMGYTLFTYKIYTAYYTEIQKKIKLICSENHKTIPKDNLHQATHILLAWLMSSSYSYKLLNPSEKEKISIQNAINSIDDFLPITIKKNNFQQNVQQIVSFSNIFCSCGTHSIDLKQLKDALPDIEATLAPQKNKTLTIMNHS